MAERSTWRNKVGLAEMLRGGVIMDVTNAEQAKIAEEAGAVAVMALERVPADIRAQGGVARMSDPEMIKAIMATVTIPVMAKARIGHFAEAQILEALGVDFVDESEVLTPADDRYHIDKHAFKVPFVCGCRDLGEALRRIGEGAAMIRTKGEAGSGNIVEAVRHMRTVMSDMRRIQAMREDELMMVAKELGAPYDLVQYVHNPTGYVANNLHGLWTTAPYLHNGSVPTLPDLLKAAKDRPATFVRGGYTVDTTKQGMSNVGHEFGSTLSDSDKADLVAYLLSL